MNEDWTDIIELLLELYDEHGPLMMTREAVFGFDVSDETVDSLSAAMPEGVILGRLPDGKEIMIISESDMDENTVATFPIEDFDKAAEMFESLTATKH